MLLPNPVEMLLQQARSEPEKPYLHQPVGGIWKSYTWSDVADQVRRMATALRSIGLSRGARIAITGINTAHWFMADLACGMSGMVSVGLYPRQRESNTRHVLAHSGCQAVFLGPMANIREFLGVLPGDLIKIALPYPDVPDRACEYQWDALIRGHEPLEDPVTLDDQAPWSLIYTSGTTGQPKGVIITHENLKFALQGMTRFIPPRPTGEHLLSYLPLAHAFERGAVEMASIYLGAQVSFLENRELLADTLRHVRPTRFFGVPLVWSRLQSAVLEHLPQSRLDRLLALPVVSTLTKRKLRHALGMDRCWLRISGAAPISLQTLEWFERIGLEICQGYGMTENTIYCSTNLPGANRAGSVGQPFPDSPVRISSDEEILNRHPGVSPGYYKDKNRTAELFTPDGWLRTGDVGYLDEDGYLYVTGRLKDIFKTDKGKYVAPGPIETAFSKDADIEQLCFIGHGLPQPVMIVALSDAARQQPKGALEERLANTMHSINLTLEAHERIFKVLVTREPWTIENGLITPTFKVRRNEVERRYGALLHRKTRQHGAVIWED